MTVPRILFVTHAYPRFVGDAPGSFVHRLVRGVQALGAEVRVLAPHAEGLAEREVLEGVPIHRYRYASETMETLAYTGTMAEQVLGSWRGKVAFGAMLLAGTRALRREIRTFRPTVVHAHWWFPSGMLAAMGAGATPVVITMHGSDVRLAVSRPVVHPIARRVLGRAAAVTAVSGWLARQATALGTRHAIRVAPMAVDTERFQPADPAVGADRPLVFAGRLNAQKGLADLLDAMARLKGSAMLQVIGEGEDRAALEARAARLGIAARIRWLGRGTPERLATAFRGAAAVVIPSREEGLGLVAVEAQLCGAPVIGYRSGGLPDVIDPSYGGVLVEPGDIAQLASAIDAVLAAAPDPSRRDAAVRVMRGRFAPQAVAERYVALYREVGAL
ncbi:MAG: glycosyltransferase [Gemmatimonadota bacterium]|nr:glycosyltransferase [Gemmatimonadota bacterium]